MIINCSSLFETSSNKSWIVDCHRYSFSVCKSINYLWLDNLMTDLLMSMFKCFSKNQFRHPWLFSIWLRCYMWSRHSFSIHVVLWLQYFHTLAYLVGVFYFCFLNVDLVRIDFCFLNSLILHLNLFACCFPTE